MWTCPDHGGIECEYLCLEMISEFACSVPTWMVCPITLYPMKEPVIDCHGHTFEREALLNWLKRNTTSPYTGVKYAQGGFYVTNYALRNAIANWWRNLVEARHHVLSKREMSDMEATLLNLQTSPSTKKDNKFY